ncbi:MAG: substrate-binding domain-containing protein [Acidobacteria bacterium]|nr:substrate-binding domain-containing protein [Acidobacteriota bacterium]
MKSARILTAALTLGSILFFSACSPDSNQKKSFTIAVIPQGTTHEYWKAIHAGAVKATEDLAKEGIEVKIIWKGPLREDDREQQVQVVEGFISQGVDGIVLAPFDRDALVRPVQEAKRAGIPTVVVDSPLSSNDPIAVIATNNYHGGEIAAECMASLLQEHGKVMLLGYQEGVASTEAREKGFLDKMKSSFPKITILSSDQFAGATRDTAKRAAENMLNRYGDEIQGIFTPNESSTVGTLLALEDLRRVRNIRLVGFDSSEELIAAMRALKLHGIVVQNPFRIGELGVKTIVNSIRKQPFESRVDTGETLVRPETMDGAEAQLVLHPPVAKYLK